jgi:hypothetical protein
MILKINVRRSPASIVWMCCAIFLTMSSARTVHAAPATVISPDGKIKIEIRADAAGQLTWSVQRQGQIVLAAAPLGLTMDGQNLGQPVKLGAPRNRTINERYPTWGNHAVAVNHCNEAVIPGESAGGMKYELEVRAIEGEATSWALPPAARAWWARYKGRIRSAYRGRSDIPA